MLGVFRDGEVVRDAARWKFTECKKNRCDDARQKHLSNVVLRSSEVQRHLRDRCGGIGWGVHLGEQVPNAFSNESASVRVLSVGGWCAFCALVFSET
jgi:hypothetical protein